jgi:hypothetical protein
VSDVDAAGKNLVFIVGSPRSGTSWLARLMGSHGEVAATQETELLNRYCRPWYDAWDEQLPVDAEEWSRHRHKGLPSLLTTDELNDYAVGFARTVYAKVAQLKPSARVIVDKNPAYSLHIDLIRRMFPDAGIVHIVRDGRDVAASMTAASRGWGRDWAPAEVGLAGRTWRTNVEAAAAASTSGRYLEVRYEDLIADGACTLAECLGFAGVAATREQCTQLVERFDLRHGTGARGGDSLVWSGEVVQRLGRAPEEPAGFIGSGGGGWRDTWTARDQLDFDHVAGDLLRTLGYTAGDEWPTASAAQRLRAAARHRTGAAVSRLGWRVHMLLGRRGLYVQVGRVAPYPRRDPT